MTSNLQMSSIGDKSLGHALDAGALVTALIALLLFGLRMFVRSRIVRKVGWDDYILILSMASTSVNTLKLSRISNRI